MLSRIITRSLIALIHGYQKVFSPDKGVLRSSASSTCVFTPSCSEYGEAALKKYGVLRGGLQSLRRISHCHPWQKQHYDPLL